MTETETMCTRCRKRFEPGELYDHVCNKPIEHKLRRLVRMLDRFSQGNPSGISPRSAVALEQLALASVETVCVFCKGERFVASPSGIFACPHC